MFVYCTELKDVAGENLEGPFAVFDGRVICGGDYIFSVPETALGSTCDQQALRRQQQQLREGWTTEHT